MVAKTLLFPNSVTSIGDEAFVGCDSLTSVVWNVKKCSDFKNLENRPFRANNITSFTFGDEVEHIPAYLCYRMENLTSIEIPNSVTSIGECAFSNGEKLTIVLLGNSVTSIGKDAFKGCDNIKKIESKATKAPTIENVSLATLFITVDADNIIVYNAPTGSQVATYRIDGQMVALKTVTNNRTNIEVPNKGIYVVTIDGKSFKVMVK